MVRKLRIRESVSNDYSDIYDFLRKQKTFKKQGDVWIGDWAGHQARWYDSKNKGLIYNYNDDEYYGYLDWREFIDRYYDL